MVGLAACTVGCVLKQGVCVREDGAMGCFLINADADDRAGRQQRACLFDRDRDQAGCLVGRMGGAFHIHSTETDMCRQRDRYVGDVSNAISKSASAVQPRAHSTFDQPTG